MKLHITNLLQGRTVMGALNTASRTNHPDLSCLFLISKIILFILFLPAFLFNSYPVRKTFGVTIFM